MTIDHEAEPNRPPTVSPGTPAPGPASAAAPRRDAIIFVPGLGSLRHRNLAHIADVLCNEFDRAATTEAARFAVRQTTARSGDDAEVVRTIWRIDGDDSAPVVDIYGVDHSTIEQADAIPTNPVARVLTLALTVLAGVMIWSAAWFRRNRRAKTFAQMLQLLLCLAILLLLGAYLVTAVFALAQLVMTAVAESTGKPPPTITSPQVLVVVAAVLGTLLPQVREHLTTAAEQYLRMMRYLWIAGPRNNLRGELLTLLERASERDEVNRIHLVGFSFGSLVAIDMVLPASKSPTARMARVTSLTTVGCPFDQHLRSDRRARIQLPQRQQAGSGHHRRPGPGHRAHGAAVGQHRLEPWPAVASGERPHAGQPPGARAVLGIEPAGRERARVCRHGTVQRHPGAPLRAPGLR